MQLTSIILPELIVGSVACLLLLFGISNKPPVRRLAAQVALATLLGVFVWLLMGEAPEKTLVDPAAAVRLNTLGYYIKLLAAGIGSLFVLVNWPTNRDATGNRALNFGADAGEFFGLMLLSIAGLMLVASANDLILLFLAIELASLPAYVMVSISRPIPVAQEAGVKYFFLGAMAAAILLFGLSYLYGSTGGRTSLYDIASLFHAQVPPGDSLAPVLTTWQMLAVVVTLAGLLFKLAAAPFHTYVGDVYEGAATPVTAFLGFVPKASGLVALLKILFVASGGTWNVDPVLFKLVWWLAALTMTFGNVLGVLQKHNVKRALAYSSVAHSGYMLVGVAALLADPTGSDRALQAVLFYLAAYGLMNTGAFAVLTALPARDEHAGAATSAETYDDLAGSGRRHLWLGLAMAFCCFSLIGIPITIGFFGKLYIVQPALTAGLYGLVTILIVNAAISAAYYLRIIAAIFLRIDPTHGRPGAPATHVAYQPHAPRPAPYAGPPTPLPLNLAVGLTTAGVLLFGVVLPATQILSSKALASAVLDVPPYSDQPAAEPGGATPVPTAAASTAAAATGS